VIEDPLRILGVPGLEPLPHQTDAIDGHEGELFDAGGRVIGQRHHGELRIDGDR
jgi:hypothetical protein